MSNKIQFMKLQFFLLVFLATAVMGISNINNHKAELRGIKPEIHSKGTKLDSKLYQLLDIYSKYGIKAAEDFSKAWQHPLKNGRLTLLIQAKAIDAYDRRYNAYNNPKLALQIIKSELNKMDAKILGEFNNYIEANIRIDNLRELADIKEIKMLSLPFFKKHMLKSEGVKVTGASKWQEPQVKYSEREEPVKIAILDLGFKGYQNLLGIELPAQVTAKSFRDDGDIAAGEEHGTACAEIVYDMAPDAKLYLVNFDLFDEFQNAVDWLISEKVDIISFSIGYFNAGAGNGTGPVNDVVNKAVSAGITWVVAAGNEAVSHWRGNWDDNDNDKWLNFKYADETNEFFAYAGDTVYVLMNWDDWYESNQDYDLYIFDNNKRIVVASTNEQNGDDWPEESVIFIAPFTGTYHAAVYNYSTTKKNKIELFFSKDYPEYYTSAYSLTIPADNPKAITAGATFWGDDNLEYFSSRGPTKNGTTKPDFSSPDGVSTASYGERSFYGTSAATPHISGAIGLLMDKVNIFTKDQILHIIQSRAIDYGQQGKDNLYGIGRLYLLPE